MPTEIPTLTPTLGPTKQKNTNIVIPSGNDVNQSITLSAPLGWNTYKIKDPVNLAVVPYSDHTIFLDEKNLKIYQLENNVWILINDDDPHPPAKVIMLPNEIPAASTVMVMAVPRLLSQSNDIELLLVISANYYDNKIVGDEISAYTYVTLYP